MEYSDELTDMYMILIRLIMIFIFIFRITKNNIVLQNAFF